MGQGASQPDRRVDSASRPSRRASVFRRSLHALSSDEGQRDGLLDGQHRAEPATRTPRVRARHGSVHRLSHLFHSGNTSPDEPHERLRDSAVLQRTRSTLSSILTRRDTSRTTSRDISRPTPRFLQHRTSYVRTGMNSDGNDYYPPRLPSIDITSTFDHDTFDHSSQDPDPPLPRSSSSNRRTSLRLNPLRPDRTIRHLGASIRNRRRPSPEIRRINGVEDQAAMLSRLLSVAAAATAATLMGDDHHALTEARSLSRGTGVGDIGGGGEDGSFDGFLRALQNGRIASALRGGGEGEGDGTGAAQGPLNFFRMFRFGASGAAQPGQGNGAVEAGGNGEDGNDNHDEGRMVPIIIVGIRSISPSSSGPGASSSTDDLPPFLDTLGSFPSPVPTHALGTQGHDSIDSILRPPQNGTSFRHRRRASVGAALGRGMRGLSDRMDDQRDHRSPDRRRDRPWSVASSSSAFEPRPPPATPASPSPELSRISSRNSTPSHSRPASIVANSIRDISDEYSRRNSAIHRASATSPLSSHTEESASIHSAHSSTNLLSQSPPQQDRDSFRPERSHRRSDTAPNIHYPRFASGHPRRNGVYEPVENLPPLSRSSTANASEPDADRERRNSNTDSRSWIIYVLGGSYPENHPILTTPSLFTENPTYEDMMLLSTLLGPAKAPVATEEDVENAGGLYTIVLADSEAMDACKTATFVAVATAESNAAIPDMEQRVPLDPGQRCLVCLCDFELEETARRLAKCGHIFHKECIDQWLTQGRNSCPLCRGQGVDEKEKAEAEAEAGEASGATDSNTVAGARADDPRLVEVDGAA